MKHIYSLLVVVLVSAATFTSYAQSNKFLQKLSFDASAGYNLPVAPIEGIKKSDFAGFKNFNLGANYELSDLFGLRFTYANTAFKDKNDSNIGLTLHKFMAEGTFNIIESIDMQRNPFEMVLHGGAGISMGKSTLSSGVDKMGTIQVGLMPLYRITDNFGVHLDATYVINIKQNYGYNGKSAVEGNEHVTGEYVIMNLGLGVNFRF